MFKYSNIAEQLVLFKSIDAELKATKMFHILFAWPGVFLHVAAAIVSGDLSTKYAHHAVLDPGRKMKLYWTVDWAVESVSFAVEAATTGWVGFGISTGNGQMVDSDMVIGWVKDGEVYFKDRFADALDVPSIDEQQDYTLTEYQESGGKTVLQFHRKFDTCDPRDRKIEEGTTKVVFAYHPEDPESENDIKRHIYRGSKSILLLNNMDTRLINQSDWETFLLTTRNVTIPSDETTYWCTAYKQPALDTKHHIVKFEPYVQEGNEGMVHHLVVFECGENFTEQDFGEGVSCFNFSNMPFMRCRWGPVVFAWGIGGEAFYWPPNAGYPIGGSKFPRYYLLELHYDNPERILGRKDSSGLRMFYTRHTRKYDAGTFSVGADVRPWLMIPPNQTSWITTGYCIHDCIEAKLERSSLPGGGVKIFGVFLHTHTAGRATWTKLVRKGKAIQEIARDDNYDFNFQDIQRLRKEIIVQPGDDIIHYCKYNTMERTKLTPGGFSTRDEMCVAFMFYYPAIPTLQVCSSNEFEPVYRFMDKYFSSLNMTSSWENPLTEVDIKWNETMVTDLKNFYTETKEVNPTCRWPLNVQDTKDPRYHVLKPQIDEPLPPEMSPCQVQVQSLSPPLTQSLTAFFLHWLCVLLLLQ